VSGSGISWAICKSAPLLRQITMPAPNHSDFYRPDALPATHYLMGVRDLLNSRIPEEALPATQPTASKH